MSAISLSQLDAIAAFLEKSREHLGIEHTIRLHWPRRPALIGAKSRAKVAKIGSRGARPADTRTPVCTNGVCHAGA